MKTLLIVAAAATAVLGVLRFRQIQQQRALEAEIWAEATDPV